MAIKQKSIPKEIIFLVGPTAVGKTEIAIKLAKIINAEIISCDSMQIYKGIDIISQKPTKQQRKLIPHHLVDIISPLKNFSVADYREKSIKALAVIHKKNKIPLFVGGTGLYMKALIDGLFPSPKADFKLRSKLESEARGKGDDYLHKKLKKIDPKTAKAIHPNDTRRIIRALEVYYKTGSTMSKLKAKTKGLGKEYNVKIFCINRDRDKLYERINKRVDKMFTQGAVAECKKLNSKKLSKSAKGLLGYKEISAYINKECSKDEAKEALQQNTRRFAKRQLTWFRNDARIKFINIINQTPSQITQKIKKQINP